MQRRRASSSPSPRCPRCRRGADRRVGAGGASRRRGRSGWRCAPARPPPSRRRCFAGVAARRRAPSRRRPVLALRAAARGRRLRRRAAARSRSRAGRLDHARPRGRAGRRRAARVEQQQLVVRAILHRELGIMAIAAAVVCVPGAARAGDVSRPGQRPRSRTAAEADERLAADAAPRDDRADADRVVAAGQQLDQRRRRPRPARRRAPGRRGRRCA